MNKQNEGAKLRDTMSTEEEETKGEKRMKHLIADKT